jgi:hypothetical protein
LEIGRKVGEVADVEERLAEREQGMGATTL